MTDHVDVAPELLRWARERSGRSLDDLAGRFSKLAAWEAGTASPTMRQLEDYAQATYTPFGYLFLAEPPVERLPIPDFRTVANGPVRAPSPDLLDTIYACEQRQTWYRQYAEERGHEAVALVGSQNTGVAPVAAAAAIRDVLGFGLARRAAFPSWARAFDGLREHAEQAGILIMINGVVGNNTHRKLDADEFRGFCLVDAYAPVVFVNGADTKAAQIFTLAHELAHVTLGGSAVSGPDLGRLDESNDIERWCNEVAAELLVPASSLRAEYQPAAGLTEELDRLARLYKASTLVLLRRIRDVGLLGRTDFRTAYQAELHRVLTLAARSGSGGNFYTTEPLRVSRAFARALLTDTAAGRTTHREAFRLLGIKKIATFEELGHRLGVA
jgi:Zn-dependent peptidase ImmA (M78 family)/transcriptional regulator with XRE-family HTH domain